ncbi:MAG: AI-2E family transporter [Erysipelotrichales bacterium]|nr:AI-2E family transporter [Erysipelotrichales bacterium]
MKFLKGEKGYHPVITYSLIAIISIGFYFFLKRFDIVKEFLDKLGGILTPFVMGFAFAFLLRSPMRFIKHTLLKNLPVKEETKHFLAVVGAMIFGAICVTIFFLLLVPQLYDSVMTLYSNVRLYIDNFNHIMVDVMEKLNLDSALVIEYVQKYIPDAEKLSEIAFNTLSSLIPNVVTATINVASLTLNTLIALIVTVYFLLDIEGFKYQTKRAIYAFFENETAAYLVSVGRMSARIFNDFISGKIIDSIIIGILCYIGMTLFKMPYSLLISVIVGVTNVIPFFGPFIGAIPGAFIVLVSSPNQAIWFVLFILALQQFDGNILGPRILGDSIGLPAVWIMFAILISGGLFGLSGMLIGVPTFSVIYFLVKEKIDNNLSKKQNVIIE